MKIFVCRPASIIRLLSLLLISLMLAECSSSDKFTGFSYDPEGATITSDKEINPQHKRTIGVAEEGIWISNEFAGARMNDFYKAGDSLYSITIRPENHPVNNSPWYAFKVWADTQKTVSLEIRYEHGEHRYWPELSHDGSGWHSIDSSAYRPDTLAGTATLTLDVGPDTLWVSAQELLTQDHYSAWADSLAQKPFVRQTTAGYSHQGRAISRLEISEANKKESRGVIIIVSRLHPPETTGYMAALTFLEQLSADSELARRFRSKFEVIAYPFANPDGVENGHWRHNAGGVDLNRDWQDFNQPEPRAIKENILRYMEADSLRRVFYGIDFHSTDENIFYPINREIETFPDDFTYRWLDALMASFPEHPFEVESFDTSSPITKNWIYHTFGADALTYEVNDRSDRRMLETISSRAAELFMRQMLNEMEKLPKEN